MSYSILDSMLCYPMVNASLNTMPRVCVSCGHDCTGGGTGPAYPANAGPKFRQKPTIYIFAMQLMIIIMQIINQ